MRIHFARLLVAVTGLLIVALAMLFAVLRNRTDDAHLGAAEQVTPIAPEPGVAGITAEGAHGQATEAATIARGRAVYAEQRCRACHSIAGEGNTRWPLDGVSGRLTEQQIRQWIVAPQEMNPAVAKRGYRLSEEDLGALVAYLASSTHR